VNGNIAVIKLLISKYSFDSNSFCHHVFNVGRLHSWERLASFEDELVLACPHTSRQ